MNEKKYHIDNEPASARDVILKAKEYSEEFASSEIYQSSIAADILRKNGHTVGSIDEIKKEKVEKK